MNSSPKTNTGKAKGHGGTVPPMAGRSKERFALPRAGRLLAICDRVIRTSPRLDLKRGLFISPVLVSAFAEYLATKKSKERALAACVIWLASQVNERAQELTFQTFAQSGNARYSAERIRKKVGCSWKAEHNDRKRLRSKVGLHIEWKHGPASTAFYTLTKGATTIGKEALRDREKLDFFYQRLEGKRVLFQIAPFDSMPSATQPKSSKLFRIVETIERTSRTRAYSIDQIKLLRSSFKKLRKEKIHLEELLDQIEVTDRDRDRSKERNNDQVRTTERGGHKVALPRRGINISATVDCVSTTTSDLVEACAKHFSGVSSEREEAAKKTLLKWILATSKDPIPTLKNKPPLRRKRTHKKITHKIGYKKKLKKLPHAPYKFKGKTTYRQARGQRSICAANTTTNKNPPSHPLACLLPLSALPGARPSDSSRVVRSRPDRTEALWAWQKKALRRPDTVPALLTPQVLQASAKAIVRSKIDPVRFAVMVEHAKRAVEFGGRYVSQKLEFLAAWGERLKPYVEREFKRYLVRTVEFAKQGEKDLIFHLHAWYERKERYVRTKPFMWQATPLVRYHGAWIRFMSDQERREVLSFLFRAIKEGKKLVDLLAKANTKIRTGIGRAMEDKVASFYADKLLREFVRRYRAVYFMPPLITDEDRQRVRKAAVELKKRKISFSDYLDYVEKVTTEKFKFKYPRACDAFNAKILFHTIKQFETAEETGLAGEAKKRAMLDQKRMSKLRAIKGRFEKYHHVPKKLMPENWEQVYRELKALREGKIKTRDLSRGAVLVIQKTLANWVEILEGLKDVFDPER